MPFGKYRGWDIEDLPSHYITWMLSNTDVATDDPILAKERQDQLHAREGKGITRKGDLE